MLESSRVVFRRYRLGAAGCVLLAAGSALLSAQATPELYPAEAQVLMVEPVAVHRLANPFAPVPSSRHELADIPELLRSRERIVAIVKRTGLIDQWDVGRPWPLKLKDRLQTLVLGPMTEKDRLEALAAMVDKRLFVSTEGSKVRIAAQWTSPELALALVENTLGTLLQLRAQREGKTLQDAADSLDRQYQSVVTEMNERARRMEGTLQRPGGMSLIEGDREQLMNDQSRAAELLVASEEKHITAAVFRTSNTLRFMVVRPPVRPREASGAHPIERVAVGVFASLLAGAVCLGILGQTGGRLLSPRHVSRTLGLEVLGSLRVRAKKLRKKVSVLPRRDLAGPLLAIALALGTGAAVGFSRGNLGLAVLPSLALVGAFLLWTRPLKWPFLGLLFLAVTLDDPTDRAYAGLWQSPLWGLGKVFFTNVAFFTGFELSLMGLAFIMAVRRVWPPSDASQALDPWRGRAPLPLERALLASVIAIAVLVALGLARGGVFREALWQFRGLAMLPVVAVIALHALDLPKDLPKLLGVLLAGSLIKALLGTYFMYFVAFPSGNYPPHTTGHNDTMIFVVAVVTAITLFWEKPIRRHFWLMLLWLPFIAMALKLNDRRIAYVDIVMALGLIVWLSPMHEMKRKLKKVAVALAPVLILYGAVGWNQTTGKAFGPVQKVRSIIAPTENSEEESSNVERDIENFNITKSWEKNMFFGQGFGHAFTEYVPSNDFRQSAFGHVGHNSILWLMWIGGIFGFTAVFGYLAVGMFLLGRALPVTSDWRQRVALLVSLGIIVTYLMQAFGDMGTQSIMFDFFVGIALAIAGRLSTRAGVWRLSLRSSGPFASTG